MGTFYERRAAKAIADRTADHAAWEREQAAEQERAQRENREARKRYLDGLEQKKAEQRAAQEAELDREFAPEKTRLQNQWLADNPGRTPADFEQLAWTYLRQNMVAAKRNGDIEQQKAAFLATGQYNL